MKNRPNSKDRAHRGSPARPQDAPTRRATGEAVTPRETVEFAAAFLLFVMALYVFHQGPWYAAMPWVSAAVGLMYMGHARRMKGS